MCFRVLIYTFIVFRTSQKPRQESVKTFFNELVSVPPPFADAILQNVQKKEIEALHMTLSIHSPKKRGEPDCLPQENIS